VKTCTQSLFHDKGKHTIKLYVQMSLSVISQKSLNWDEPIVFSKKNGLFSTTFSESCELLMRCLSILGKLSSAGTNNLQVSDTVLIVLVI